jgi:glycosyltransferase involved in cell wall biosynthesis
LKIAVNTRLLLKNKLEGIGWFAYETLRRIVEQHPEVEFYFLFDRKPNPIFLFSENVKPIVLHPQARHPILFVIWFEIAVTRALRKIKPDLFLSPDGYLSLCSKTKQLTVIHDLNFEHFPKDLPLSTRLYYRYFFPRFAKRATRIATVSEFSKKDIVEHYHIEPEKIDVVYDGVNTIFAPTNNKTICETRNKISAGLPYFMFVGSLHPRKNLARLFTAFDLFKTQTHSDIKLVIVGQKKWWTKPIRLAFEKMTHKDEVIFTGRLNDVELGQVTAAAFAALYVSYFEGFGIPIIEAFRSGIPVITSNVTSMPEIAGDAALLVNPFDEQEIADAMKTISSDEKIRIQLVEKGFEQAKKFSWDISAQKLWNSILKSTESN